MIVRLFAAVFLLLALPLTAQTTLPPTPDEFLGYKLGERFTPHHRIVDYFNELARRSNLITVQTFGSTYENRPLILAVVTSPKNRAALDNIRQGLASLARGESVDVAKTIPAAVWLGFGVHGSESSSAEACCGVLSVAKAVHNRGWEYLLLPGLCF